jgi:hypothetical protein
MLGVYVCVRSRHEYRDYEVSGLYNARLGTLELNSLLVILLG